MDNQNQKPVPEQPSLQQRPSEKVIQPLNPTLRPAQAAPQPSTISGANINNTAPSSYDPTADANYRVPALDLRKPIDDNSVKTVAMRHKSLMILAIIGLLEAVFNIVAAIQVNHAIQQAQLTNTSQASGNQGLLDILYFGIAFNVLINVYFLIAKDRHTVATILKVLLVLEFISVFGIFWGGGTGKVTDLFIDGAYLLYTYIVFNVVKTAPVI